MFRRIGDLFGVTSHGDTPGNMHTAQSREVLSRLVADHQARMNASAAPVFAGGGGARDQGSFLGMTSAAALNPSMAVNAAMANTHPAPWHSDETAVRSHVWRNNALAMRLRYPQGARPPFDGLSTGISKSGELVFIYIVDGEQSVTLTDSAAMFPSDTLVAQMQLLVKI